MGWAYGLLMHYFPLALATGINRGIRKEHVTSLDELLTHHHGMVSEAVY